ncbi:MAG: site-specific DNA-methyltransferase [Myxococcota bacterium]|nr:site-specific DNA-methyltransferase [Myxococcota bacterium]
MSADKLAPLSIYFEDNLALLERLEPASFRLIYIDPPFNTGRAQRRKRIRTVADASGGDRLGFSGRSYRSEVVSQASYQDRFTDFAGFIRPRLEQAHRLLTDDGALVFHIDYREAHYCKVMLDELFGRDAFLNEIIWAYDYGARSKRRWSAKHDTLFIYVKDPKNYVFNFEAMDRIPYMAPGLVTPEKAKRGKTPTDVWWHTIVPTNGAERTGYPTQKPLGILRRLIAVHSEPGDHVLDFFAGSGTTGEAALELGRRCTLVDQNPQAVEVMLRRLERYQPVVYGWDAATR